jgi:hypothetical protein
MSDYTYLTLAKLQMNERMEEARRYRLVPGRRRRRFRRHDVANGLHSLADRIDG